MRRSLPILSVLFVLCIGAIPAIAVSPSVSYVPLIGISSVPEPISLPDGAGDVNYKYAVKNFRREAPLTDVQVMDDACAHVTFVKGDDNMDGKLDYGETWRYACTATLSQTVHSKATVTGYANEMIVTDDAHATVVVGSDQPPPIVSIVNITKVAYPLSLPAEGGKITFTYRVNNPGVVPLREVKVSDDKCGAVSGRVGDTNGNGLLDVHEVWIYTCSSTLTQTTTNTATVTAFANGLKAVDTFTLTIQVTGVVSPVPSFPDTGPDTSVKFMAWGGLFALFCVLFGLFIIAGKRNGHVSSREWRVSQVAFIAIVFVVGAGVLGSASSGFLSFRPVHVSTGKPFVDAAFGWRYPVTGFPSTGLSTQLAYSDIRDPGGIPQGLPVRLQIPAIGVDSAIEDALITPDGKMDVPAGSKNVAWFALGPHPGQIGSAVIGGHFGEKDGEKFVFYNLDKLKVGDKVYVINDKEETLAFVIRSVSLFPRYGDATTVFTSGDGLAHLNLITCEGSWNQIDGTQPERRVVFADAIPSEGAVTVNPELPYASTPIAPTTPARPLPVTVPSSLIRSPVDLIVISVLLLANMCMAMLLVRVYTRRSTDTPR